MHAASRQGYQSAVRELGIERNEMQRAVHRAENIAPDVRDLIREELPQVANTGIELDTLAKMPQDKRVIGINFKISALARPRLLHGYPDPSTRLEVQCCLIRGEEANY